MTPPARLTLAALVLGSMTLAGCATTAPPARRPGPPDGPARPARAAGLAVMPVAGFDPARLRDTFDDARSGGRTHRAIDLMAPRGTPVVAAADGVVRKLHRSALGGITLYVLLPDDRTVHYYAHLDRYARGLEEGQRVRAGDRLGDVGDTGNATTPHLHFAVWRSPSPDRFWDGEKVNPYPLLRRLADAGDRPSAVVAPPVAERRPAPRPAPPVRRGRPGW